MVTYCSAFGCKNKWNKDSLLTWHKFPRDERIKAVWVQKIRRKNWAPSSTSRICSEHFTTDCFYSRHLSNSRTRLRNNAIPTIFKFSNHLLKVTKGKKATECDSDAIPNSSQIDSATMSGCSSSLKPQVLTMERNAVMSHSDATTDSLQTNFATVSSCSSSPKQQAQVLQKFTIFRDHNYVTTESPEKLKRKLLDAQNQIKILRKQFKKCKVQLAASRQETRSISEILEFIKFNKLLN